MTRPPSSRSPGRCRGAARSDASGVDFIGITCRITKQSYLVRDIGTARVFAERSTWRQPSARGRWRSTVAKDVQSRAVPDCYDRRLPATRITVVPHRIGFVAKGE